MASHQRRSHSFFAMGLTGVALFLVFAYLLSPGHPHNGKLVSEQELTKATHPATEITGVDLGKRESDTQMKSSAKRIVRLMPLMPPAMYGQMISRLQTGLKSLSNPDENLISLNEHIKAQCRAQTLTYPHPSTGKQVKVNYVSIPSMHEDGNYTGVFLLFHGCSHTSHDFCFSTPMCPNCKALPEEIRTVHEGLRRGFRIIAITSNDHSSHCWAISSPYIARGDIPKDAPPPREGPLANIDLQNVVEVLKSAGGLYVPHETKGLPIPLVAMGASSGGSFVAKLPRVLGGQLIGVIMQVSAAYVSADAEVDKTRYIYSVMARDKHSVTASESRVAKLNEAKTRPIAVTFVLNPLKIGEDFFSNRIGADRVSLDQSNRLVRRLTADGIISDGFLESNPRHSNWRESARKVVPKSMDSLVADKSAISEELNVAYAFHEFFADHVSESFELILYPDRKPGNV